MKIKLIKNDADYEIALKRLDEIFDANENTLEGDEAEILSLFIENYEDTHYKIEAPDPIEAVKIRMEEMNLKQKDLIGVIGAKSRVSEVLNKKKKLTVKMIRNITEKMNLSANILIQNYETS